MSELTCGAILAACVCGLEQGHEGPHVCGAATVTGKPCKGSWSFRKDGVIEVVRFPDPAAAGPP